MRQRPIERVLALFSAFILLSSSSAKQNKPVGRINAEKKVVALTFDDGPHPIYTPAILDILSEYGVKATFFVIGKNVDEYPELVRRECDEGHEIGNHTYSHSYMNSVGESETVKEIKDCERSVSFAADTELKLVRPPGGICSTRLKQYCESSGYRIVLWSVDTLDWKRPSPDSIINTVLNNVSQGDIILMHDYVSGVSSTPEALKVIIPALIDEGYDFVTVSELINLNQAR